MSEKKETEKKPIKDVKKAIVKEASKSAGIPKHAFYRG